MTDRRRLTWQQAFVTRVINLSTARWIFSLLGEQWWRERSADGVVINLQVMQAWGPAVAGGLLDEDFSGLWDLVVVDEVGLIICEKIVLGQSAWLLIRVSAHGTSHRTNPHGRWRWRTGEWKGRWERRWRVQSRGSKSIRSKSTTKRMMTWRDARKTPWANVTCDIEMCAVKHEKMWRVRVFCSHTPSVAADCYQLQTIWLQPICRKSVSKFHSEFLDEWASKTGLSVLWGRSFHELRSNWHFLIYELHQCSFHWHHEVLDEEDDECHLWYW